MTLFTDKQYYIDQFLVDKMDLAIERYNHNRDSLFICDGSEGDGKSTMTFGLAYYIAWKMKKTFTVDNVFFDVEKMMKFASEKEGQIIIWDEACTMGMATSWQNRIQQKLIKVLMMTRKKKHFFFFNIPKFRKLNEYIVDRSVGLIHVYSPDMIRQGSFVYFKKDQKDFLYEMQKERGKKTYKMGWSFRGTFSNPKDIIDEVEYDKRKDQAILDIFKDEKPGNDGKYKKMLDEYRRNIALCEGYTLKERAKMVGVTEKTISKWKNTLIDHPVEFKPTMGTA